jgi:uncharacterized membrane protein YphA (DoxX/SURF4 family)
MSRGRSALSWLGLILRLAAAGVWVAAGVTKLPDIQAFQLLVDRYGILPRVLAGPFAYALPFVELGIGVYLLAGLFVRGASLAGTILLCAFLTAQVTALARGITLDCGCFGTVVESSVGPLTILRDFCLGIPTFLMLAFPARAFSLDSRLFGAHDSFAHSASKSP